MFQKLVAIEPLSLIQSANEELQSYAKSVTLYDNIPANDAEIIRRIGDADAVLLSYTSTINKSVLDACPNIRYIGMCCSLYAPENANVDILTAKAHGITVSGVRDYGDQGVVEYVIYALVSYLHGYGGKQWQPLPTEFTGLKVGIVGMGVTGQLISNALQMLGADVSYFSRTRKPAQEAAKINYLPFQQLLESSDVVISCLNKNVILFHEEQFGWMGNHKILFNTSIGPAHDLPALRNWLAHGDNEFFCDTAPALGADADLLASPHVNCVGASAGRTSHAFVRLSEKVLHNIRTFLAEDSSN